MRKQMIVKHIKRILLYRFFWVYLFMPYAVASQTDTITMQEVEVHSSRIRSLYSEHVQLTRLLNSQDISNNPSGSMAGLLNSLTSVDLRQRGPLGVQGDLGIRAGTFEQSLLLIDGVQINDPQTGHHSLNLAPDSDDLERIELLEGSGSRIFGPNAMAGAVNLVTRKPLYNSLRVFFGVGQYGLNQQRLSFGIRQKNFSNLFSVGRVSSDGYRDNTDFNQFRLLNKSELDLKPGLLSLTAALASNAFGAYKFYTGAYPWQYEQVRTGFARISFDGKGRNQFRAGVHWRRNFDRFELFREGKGWYEFRDGWYVRAQDTAGFPSSAGLIPYAGHNFHLTDVLGAETGLSRSGFFGRASIGASWKFERIRSTVLGQKLENPAQVTGYDARYGYGDTRNHLNLYADYSLTARFFGMSTGALLYYQPEYGWFFSPGADVEIRLKESVRLFASVNRALRIPTFTDLYYKGPVNQANPLLKPESALNWETGVLFSKQGLQLRTSLFIRQGRDIIDWVKPIDSVKWISMNHTRLLTKGAELSAVWNRSGISKWLPHQLGFSSSFYEVSKQEGNFQSAYALDYIRLKLNFSGVHKLPAGLGLSWNLTYRDREGGWFDAGIQQQQAFEPVWLLDAKLSWYYRSWKLHVGATNCFDQPYYDISNVVMPGRWINAGIGYEIRFK
jgi:iron complex outermembrane receptor protein